MSDDLDLSQLTDDQLIALARLVAAEVAQRGSDVHAAAQQVALDEAEKLRIAKRAAELEAAAARDAERKRIAEDARRAVRDATSAAATTAKLDRARRIQEAQRRWIARAAALVDQPPGEITVCRALTAYGDRVLINLGDRYARDHLVDYNVGTAAIKTSRALIARKTELTAYCIGFCAEYGAGAALTGNELDWS